MSTRRSRPVLPSEFRAFAAGLAQDFIASKDRVYQLLGRRQNASSGHFREELLRAFLRRILPSGLSVDSGFVYGFGQVPTSAQLDIIVWNKSAYAPIYDAGTFVIVAPESVVAVVSVKSKLTLPQLADGLTNLLTVSPIDFAFRSPRGRRHATKSLPAITKLLIFYSPPTAHRSILPRISETISRLLEASTVRGPLVEAMRQVDPFAHNQHENEARRALPRLITVIEPCPYNYVQGLGPPSDEHSTKTFGGGMRRLPWIYRHDTQLTSAFEKFIFHLLAAATVSLDVPGLSTLAAWADVDPLTGIRADDIEEIIGTDGAPLLAAAADRQ